LNYHLKIDELRKENARLTSENKELERDHLFKNEMRGKLNDVVEELFFSF
jgi:hypothetical protein